MGLAHTWKCFCYRWEGFIWASSLLHHHPRPSHSQVRWVGSHPLNDPCQAGPSCPPGTGHPQKGPAPHPPFLQASFPHTHQLDVRCLQVRPQVRGTLALCSACVGGGAGAGGMHSPGFSPSDAPLTCKGLNQSSDIWGFEVHVQVHFCERFYPFLYCNSLSRSPFPSSLFTVFRIVISFCSLSFKQARKYGVFLA